MKKLVGQRQSIPDLPAQRKKIGQILQAENEAQHRLHGVGAKAVTLQDARAAVVKLVNLNRKKVNKGYVTWKTGNKSTTAMAASDEKAVRRSRKRNKQEEVTEAEAVLNAELLAQAEKYADEWTDQVADLQTEAEDLFLEAARNPNAQQSLKEMYSRLQDLSSL